jgi:hypothetical protein
MSALLDAFRERDTIDRALVEVYGFDSNGLEARWREDVGLPARAPRSTIETGCSSRRGRRATRHAAWS